MSTESRLRDALVTYFPMFIATVSVLASIYSAYIFARSVEVMQRNVDRFETMRTCRDLIDAYFQIKLRASLLAAAAGTDARIAEGDAAAGVSMFGALGTYLANLSVDGARERYTQLSLELARVVAAARTTPAAGVEKLFDKADQLFSVMNDDCVRTARTIM
jgi:hypothetical protein